MKNIPFEIDSEKTEAFLASVDHNAYDRAMERARKMSGSASLDSRPVKTQLYHDNFQNYKRYNIPKAQLVIADIPYNIGVNFYGSNPTWYIGGDRENGEIVVAGGRTLNSINLNDRIKVKLTTHGQEIYRSRWEELNRMAGRVVVFPHYARVDKEGYTSFQLWDFIETFGEHIGITKPNVIEPLNIYSVDDEKEQVGEK